MLKEGVRPRWYVRHRVEVILVLFSLLFGGAVTVLHDQTASPIDELVYIDYLNKVPTQGMVFEGEKFGPEVAELVGCEGVFPFGTLGLSCPSAGPSTGNDGMPNEGFTTGAAYTPVYFWLTRTLASPLELFGVESVTAWRMTGLIWLAAGMVLLTGLLRRWKIDDRIILTLGSLYIVSPFSIWTYTYISTDVSAFVFGAGTLLLATEVIRGRRSAWWFVPIAALAVAFKVTNLLPLALVLAYFVFYWLHSRSQSIANQSHKRGAARIAVLLSIGIASGITLQYLWMKLFPLLAASDTRVDQGISRELNLLDLVNLFAMGPWSALTHSPISGLPGSAYFLAVATPLSWLAITAVLGTALSIPWKDARAPIVWASVVTTLLALPVLGVGFYALTGSYFELPGRYVASLMPAVLLLGGFLLRNLFAMWLLRAYAVTLGLSAVAQAVMIRQLY